MLNRLFAVLLVVSAAVSPLAAAGVDKDNLKEYGKGIIEDYSDMSATDTIEWLWVALGVDLGKYRFNVAKVENITVIADGKMEEVFEDTLPRSLDRAGSKDKKAPVLNVEGAVYWAQRANRAKWWIPYAGLHLAQAGVGVELIFTNDKGETVAKMRHSGREGDNLENAAEELVDDIAQFIRSN